jgi:hypothetical protein
MLEKHRQYRILKRSPKILVNTDKQIGLIWSAKAGSVFAIKWFLYHLGQLELAKSSTTFIHQYRSKLTENPQHVLDLKAALRLKDEYQFIKLVRNPFSRAVSSFIHCLNMVKKNNQVAINLMTKSQTIPLKEQYSFEEFIERISELDINNCNIHWRVQKHKAEREEIITVNHLVKLEESINGFKKIESSLRLEPSSILEFTKSNHHNRKANDHNGSFLGQLPLNFKVRANTPKYNFFYNDDLKNKVYTIYKEDFETYDYPYQI